MLTLKLITEETDRVISGLEKKHFKGAKEAIDNALDLNNRRRIIPTSQLNNYMQEVIAAYPPPANKGKYVKIKYVTMLKEQRIPTFVFFCNLPQWVKEPYRRYLENKIRENWDFTGTPAHHDIRPRLRR